MADISNVINIQLLQGGRLAQADNMNIVSIITSDNTHLSTAKRFDIYRDLASVAEDFGTFSSVYEHAASLFATQPNPVNAGGYLVVGYWRAVDEDTDATAANLEGAQLSEAATVGNLQQISDGSFDIDVDGVTQNLTALNFQSVTSLDDVVTVIDTALTGATASLDNIGIVITSDTTGAASTLTVASEGSSGTFVGNLLGLAAGTGAVLTQGAAAGTITAESKVDAITEIKSQAAIRGAVFIDKPTDIEAKALATWAQANSVLVYDVFSDAANLNVDPANVVWDIKLSGLTFYRMLFSLAGNRKLATSYMARNHTVNFNAENSAITMNLKELAVSPETYSEAQINSAKTVGLDLYTTIKNTPVLLTSTANEPTDNVYNLAAFVDSQQVAGFNHLKGTATKIPQTTAGVLSLVDALERDARRFVRAAVLAPGTWSSPDTFGDLDTFKRNIEANGYYYLAGKLSDQPQVDREARKSPVIQGAIKNAGAIHSADIIINFNA